LGASNATLVSDKTDYLSGSTANLTGTGFVAGETVTLQVLHADGTMATGAEHAPWTVTAGETGDFTTTWHVCEDDCVGSLLRATATGQSGLSAFVDSTDACGSGNGVVTLTANGSSCLAGTPPSGSGPFNWEVAEGGSYTMTISGVTECTGTAITVFVQN